MSPITRHLMVLTITLGSVATTTTTASAAAINVSPTTVAPGGSVALSGDVLAGGVPGCGVPGTVTLISDAFVGLGEFAGVGAVNLPVDATGHFAETVTLTTSVAPGTYSITGRCGGGNMGVEATLVVGGLPRTGPSQVIVPFLGGSASLVAIGVVLLGLARRRRRVSA